MFLSAEDRERLCEALTDSVNTLECPKSRTIFLLMIAMLHDHRELELTRQQEAKEHLQLLMSMGDSLRQMAKEMGGSPKPERTAWK